MAKSRRNVSALQNCSALANPLGYAAITNPQTFHAKELAAVAGVGLVLSLVGSQVAIPPVVLGSGMYLLGYFIRGERPATGWHKALM